MPTIQETLATERARYGERLTAAEAIELLTRTAAPYAAEYGLLAKTTGNNWGGKAVDILAHVGGDHHYDVLIDAPDVTQTPPYAGTCQPAWQDKGPYDPGRFVPVNPAPPVPPDPPTPPVDDHKDIWIAVAALRNDLTALESAVKLIGAEVEDQARRITALEQAPPPTIPPFSYTVRTSSARLALTHNHEVTVTYPPPTS